MRSAVTFLKCPKSKVDTMSKFLICLQGGWFIVQAISRLATNLPVTLLEVNTIGHVTCALAIDLLWWNKPRQTNELILLKGDWLPPIAAYMFISSRVSGEDSGRARGTLFSRPDPEILQLAYFPPQSECARSDTPTKTRTKPSMLTTANPSLVSNIDQNMTGRISVSMDNGYAGKTTSEESIGSGPRGWYCDCTTKIRDFQLPTGLQASVYI